MPKLTRRNTSRKPTAAQALATIATLLALTFTAGPVAANPPPGFLRLSEVAPGVVQDIRYASVDNFTGAPVPGYAKPECWIKTQAAYALAAAERDAERSNMRLVVWDCYRPKRAVSAFVAWTATTDETTKPKHYPNVAKSALLGEGYIARASAHSTGLAVDLGVVGWNFGTPFDYFDPKSMTQAIPNGVAAEHRVILVDLMKRHGFSNYPREWWHFSFGGATNAPRLDAEINN